MPASPLSSRLPVLRRLLRRHRRVLLLLALTVILAQAALAAAARFAPASPVDPVTQPAPETRVRVDQSEAAVAIPVPSEAFAALLTPGTPVEVVCGSAHGGVTRIPGRIADMTGDTPQTGTGTPLTGGAAPSAIIVMEHTDVSDALHCSQEIWSSVVMVN